MNHPFSNCQDTENHSPLRAAFGSVFHKISAHPKSASALALTEFVAGVLLSRPFKNSDFARSLDPALSQICTSIVLLCLTEGLAEPERLAYAAAFEPYFALVEAGTRH